MALLKFGSKNEAPVEVNPEVAAFLQGYSIEVMPRTADKVENFRAILPKGTRVYIAHIEGTPIEDMVATAKRISGEGFDVMPHFPARIIKDEATLGDWIARYQGEAGVEQALLLAGGVAKPHGDYDSSTHLEQRNQCTKEHPQPLEPFQLALSSTLARQSCCRHSVGLRPFCLKKPHQSSHPTRWPPP